MAQHEHGRASIREAFEETIAVIKARIARDEKEVSRLERLAAQVDAPGIAHRERTSSNGTGERGFTSTGMEYVTAIGNYLSGRANGKATLAEIRAHVGTSDISRYVNYLVSEGKVRDTGERRPSRGRKTKRRSAVYQWVGDTEPGATVSGPWQEAETPEPAPEPEPTPEPAAEQAPVGTVKRRRRRGRKLRPREEVTKLVEDYIATHRTFTKGHVVAATGLSTSTVHTKVEGMVRQGLVKRTDRMVKGPAGKRMAPEYQRLSATDRLPTIPPGGLVAGAVQPRRERVLRPGEPPREGRILRS